VKNELIGINFRHKLYASALVLISSVSLIVPLSNANATLPLLELLTVKNSDQNTVDLTFNSRIPNSQAGSLIIIANAKSLPLIDPSSTIQVVKNIKQRVSQSEIDQIKKMGKKLATEIAASNKGSVNKGTVASFAEGVRLLYGDAVIGKGVSKTKNLITHKVTGLTPGVEYSFKVVATNSKNQVFASPIVNFQKDSTIPNSPVISKVEVFSSTQATVFFTAPSFDGGSAIDSYTVTASPGQITTTVNQPAGGQIILSGLTESTNYTFTITANNKKGTSTASKASNQITTPVKEIIRFQRTVPTGGPTLAAPAFTLSSSSESRTVNTAATGFTIASSTGGTIASFGISATPPGMSFSTTTGALTGTPNTVATATALTITATNTAGSATQTFTFTVTAALAAPAFTLSSASESRTVNTAATGFTIATSTGGTIASFGINATPPGMSFNTSTGALTGTPNTVATATSFTITATNAAGSVTQTFTLTVIATVAIFTQPIGGANVSVLSTQPVVRVVDGSGNAIASFTSNVVAAIASGTGTLSGTTTVAAVAGVATFTNLVITGTAGAFTLRFTPSGLTAATSNALTVTAGAENKYVVTSSSTAPAAGSAVTISAQLTDISDNTISTAGKTVTWSKSNANGSFATATSTTNAAGIATISFTVHTVSATTTTVTATSSTPTLTGTSSTITTVAGAASKITVYLAASPTRILFQGQPEFRIQDAFSNNITTSTATITAALTAGTGGTIQGTTTAVAAGAFGRASFTNLGVDGVISNSYTITYSSPGLTSLALSYTLLGNFCDEFQGVLTGTTCDSTNSNRASVENITIFSGYTLILNGNSSSEGSISNLGTIINKGTYAISGVGINNISGSTFINEDILDLNGGLFTNSSGATTTNTSVATININFGSITTSGTFNNFGTINRFGGTITGTITGNPPN
jgi:hypothetical protein